MSDVLERLSRALEGRYHVKHELGAGGWATVYLATDMKHQREVAFKVLRPEVASAIGLERFVREIEVAARLRHPNILPLYDSGEADGLFYYVMPYVEGESLRDVLNREIQLPIDGALKISHEVADALALAHSHGVIHRDVKPENILLDAGHAVVADFGIARAVLETDSERLTGSGIAVGTPEYMSPEQAAGEGEIDARSDIYSLGCVLYEMLVGEPPFEGRTIQAIIARHMTGASPRASETRSTVPSAVDAIVTRALAKVPADRFGGAERLAVALEKARTGSGEPSVGIGTTRSFSLPVSWMLLAAVLVVGGVIGWFAVRVLGGSAETDTGSPILVVPPFSHLSRDTTQDYLVAGITEAVKTELMKISDLIVVSGTPERLSDDDARHAMLLIGSMATQGDRVTVTARMEKLSSGQNMWGHTYVEDLHDVLGLYADVARAITQEIEAELTPEEEARLQETRTVDPEAYNLYLRGRFHWNRRSPADLLRAVEYFEQSIEVDSSSALAYAGLADAYVLFPQYAVPGMSNADALQTAERFARAALARDSLLGEARTALAHIRFVAHRDWSGAESEFRRALDLSPGYAVLHQWYGEYLRAKGNVEEGLAETRLAHQLAPQEPYISVALAMGLWCARRYEEAESQARFTIDELDSDYLDAYYSLSLALLGQSRFAEMEAAAVAARLPAGLPAGVRRALEDANHRNDAVRSIAAASGQLDHFKTAALYASIGVGDSAFVALQNAEAQGDVFALMLLTTAPIFDFLRDDPLYADLVERFGVPR
jgi:serine/threonine-protein kinase